MAIIFTAPDVPPNWDLSSLSYDGISKIISTSVSTPSHLTFDPNGNYFFVIDNSSSSSFKKIHRFDMSTPWDITSAPAASSQTLDVNGISSGKKAVGLAISANGEHLYHGINNNPGEIHHWIMSTPWDLTTAVNAFGMVAGAFGTVIEDLSISDDGNNFVASLGATSTVFRKWTMATPYSLSSVGGSTDSGIDVKSSGFYLNGDGTQYMTIIGGSPPYPVRQYKLSTGFDWEGTIPPVESESLNQVNIQHSFMHDVYVKPDGTKMFLVSITAVQTIFQYSIG